MTKPLYMSQKEISIVITMCKMYYFNFMFLIIIKNKKVFIWLSVLEMINNNMKG